MTDRTTQTRVKIASALEPLMARNPGDSQDHPGVDELLHYHGGTLPDAEAERIRGHLIECSECLESLLDLDAFVSAPELHQPDLPDLETETAWRAMRARVQKKDRWPALALAASLLLALLGTAFWAVRQRGMAEDLRQQVARLSAPQPNAPIVDLFSESAVRGEAASRSPVEIPAGTGFLTLVLSLPGPSELEAFEADIVDAQGRTTWTGKLEMSRHGTFRLGIWRNSLGSGEHTIHLYGLDGGRRVLLESYPLRFTPAGGAD